MCKTASLKMDVTHTVCGTDAMDCEILRATNDTGSPTLYNGPLGEIWNIDCTVGFERIRIAILE